MRFYYTYIVANHTRSVLYIGMTGNIQQRIQQHFNGEIEGFSKKYNCKYLVYYEKFTTPLEAISREKQIKKWNRKKKEDLINKTNPQWKSINKTVFLIDEQYL